MSKHDTTESSIAQQFCWIVRPWHNTQSVRLSERISNLTGAVRFMFRFEVVRPQNRMFDHSSIHTILSHSRMLGIIGAVCRNSQTGISVVPAPVGQRVCWLGIGWLFVSAFPARFMTMMKLLGRCKIKLQGVASWTIDGRL